MKSWHIRAIDFVLIAASLLLVAVLVGYYNPKVTAPVSGYSGANSSILFNFSKSGALIFDDNPSFSSPERIPIEDSLVIQLNPGVYYWKVEGEVPSTIRNLTILSLVDLRLQLMDNKVFVVNAGNVGLEVLTYNGSRVVDKSLIAPAQTKEAVGSLILGRQEI